MPLIDKSSSVCMFSDIAYLNIDGIILGVRNIYYCVDLEFSSPGKKTLIFRLNEDHTYPSLAKQREQSLAEACSIAKLTGQSLPHWLCESSDYPASGCNSDEYDDFDILEACMVDSQDNSDSSHSDPSQHDADPSKDDADPPQDDVDVVADSDEEELHVDDEFHLKSTNITATPCSFLRNPRTPCNSSARELTVKEITRMRLEARAAKRARANVQPNESRAHKRRRTSL